jgi:hypothetical protein
LWEKSVIVTDELGLLNIPSWRLRVAYPSYEVCVSKINPMAQYLGEFWRIFSDELLEDINKKYPVKGSEFYVEDVLVVEDSYLIRFNDKNRKAKPFTRIFRLQCFPDTIDPRK